MTRNAEKPKVPKPKFSFRKHIVPPVTGLLIMGMVFSAMNIEWLMAQSRYRFMEPATVNAPALVQTAAQSNVPTPQPDPSQPARITIPAIGVDAPIVLNETSVVEWKVQVALRSGTVHYGDTAVPGQGSGNVVIIGHSSGLPWAPGDYKWVFTMLDKLKKGDQIHVSYQGLPYVYEMTESEVVEPTDVRVLNQTATPMLTLITCTPIGTAKQRLIIKAKQVSPVPAKSTANGKSAPPAAKPAELPR
jgi:sortase A